ncbi:MAG: adenylate/guanylate cyclase domain-containing protein [Hyphomicrobiaceae bacterium]|nr:MAG: adenylate/guanylate cyclase domain-containing protein [Hyphomicrobiaceae bacterium]
MRFRLVYALMVLCLLAVAFLARLADPVPVARLRLLVFDTYQQMKPLQYDPKLPVRIIDVDEESLARVGQWPWPRIVTGAVVERLADLGAAVVAFDMVFPEADRTSPREVARVWSMNPATKDVAEKIATLPGHDEALAEALGRVPVILGFFAATQPSPARLPERSKITSYAGDHPVEFVPGFEGVVTSLPVLQEKSAGVGHLNFIPEYDQVARRVPLLVGIGQEVYPSVSVEALRLYQKKASVLVKSTGASGEETFGGKRGVIAMKVGDFVVPTDQNGQMWLRYTPHDERRFIPAHKLLEDSVPKSEIEGKIILIGTSAAGLFDLRTTPLDGSVPGVEVHAQAIEQMLTGRHLLRPDFATGLELAFLMLSGMVLTFLILHSGAFAGALVGAVSVAGVNTASWIAFDHWGFLFDPVYPSLMLTGLYVFGTVYVYRGTEREKRRVRDAFSHYMSPAIVEELARDPSKLKLGGEMREVTILFCDVRGFTTISEGLDAESLTRFLNRLLTPLTNTVLAHRGTIDKYMGDGVMAFWNAPLDDIEHAGNACRAALEMLEEIERLNAATEREAAAAGRRHMPIRVGIGINTALSCVGNLGSEQRFDYSVIGDGVNVASRLEGQTKFYGAPILIGESVAQAAPDFALLEVDFLSVKGKSKPLHVFALVGGEERKSSTAFEELKHAHDSMLHAYRARRFEEAGRHHVTAEALGGKGLAMLYRLYGERIAAFKATPPPADWDGRAVAETK